LRLTEIPENPAPPGWTLHEIAARDGVKLRAAVWPAVTDRPRGTMVVCTGRTEFIEKYFEFIGEVLARGYAVVCFDWRGQGLSQRIAADRMAGHVRRFSDYELDLEAVVAQLLPDLPKPHVLFGHSMGGHIALRYLAAHPKVFAKAFLSAPMLKAWMPALLRLVSMPLAWTMRSIGRGEGFVPGGKGSDGLGLPFESNRVTSDPHRYARNNAILRADPELIVCGPTWTWVGEAFRSMRGLRRKGFGKCIQCPLLIAGAAHDRIVNQGPDMTLIRNVKRGLFVLFSDAEHELVQERDEVRRVFWTAADAFLAANKPV